MFALMGWVLLAIASVLAWVSVAVALIHYVLWQSKRTVAGTNASVKLFIEEHYRWIIPLTSWLIKISCRIGKGIYALMVWFDPYARKFFKKILVKISGLAKTMARKSKIRELQIALAESQVIEDPIIKEREEESALFVRVACPNIKPGAQQTAQVEEVFVPQNNLPKPKKEGTMIPSFTSHQVLPLTIEDILQQETWIVSGDQLPENIFGLEAADKWHQQLLNCCGTTTSTTAISKTETTETVIAEEIRGTSALPQEEVEDLLAEAGADNQRGIEIESFATVSSGQPPAKPSWFEGVIPSRNEINEAKECFEDAESLLDRAGNLARKKKQIMIDLLRAHTPNEVRVMLTSSVEEDNKGRQARTLVCAK